MRTTLDFLLDDWIGLGDLLERPRFREHSRETFRAVLEAEDAA